ncbi:glycosyltransferase [bacterium]|nr:glycosyltransferase [bacterium]
MLEILTVLLRWSIYVDLAIIAVSAACLLRFYFRKAPALNARKEYPGVSLIKPCHKAEDNEEENFDAYFKQDYPGPLEVMFVVSSDKAPIVPLIQEYIARYPKVDARMVVSLTRDAFAKKTDAIHDGQLAAKYDFILLSDSDTIVRENYVTEMVACLEEPGVSLVTVPQVDVRMNNFASGFKVMGNTCDLIQFVILLDTFDKKKKVGWGHSMAYRRSEFDQIPNNWDIMNRFLTDDQALPYLFTTSGRKVVWRNIYCPVEYSNKTLKDVIFQKRKWVAFQQIAIGNRFLYLLALLAYPQIPALFLMLLTGFSAESLGLFALAAGARIGLSVLYEALFLKTLRMNLRYFWTIPLWDLAQIYFILDGFFRSTLQVDGKTCRVVDRYYLETIPAKSTVS